MQLYLKYVLISGWILTIYSSGYFSTYGLMYHTCTPCYPHVHLVSGLSFNMTLMHVGAKGCYVVIKFSLQHFVECYSEVAV